MPGPKERHFTLHRGDTWPLFDASADEPVTFSDGRDLETPGVILRCTVKRDDALPDPVNPNPLIDAANGVLQVDSDDRGGITIVDEASYRVVFPPAQTELLKPGLYFYDVTIDMSLSESYVLWWGTIKVRADITRTRS